MKRKGLVVGGIFLLLLSSFPVTIYGETTMSSSDTISEALASSSYESLTELQETNQSIEEVSGDSTELTDTETAVDSFESTSSETTESVTENSGRTEDESVITAEVNQEETLNNSEEIPSDTEEDIVIDDMYYADEEGVYPKNRSENAGDETSMFRAFAEVLTNPDVSADNLNTPSKSFVDVSSWNYAVSVDEFKIMKNYGVTGVVVKLTEGTYYQNPYAEIQIKNAKAAGLKVSTYHYSKFTTVSEAQKEANYYAAMANSLGLSKSTVMVNDIEDGSMSTNKNNTTNSLAFAQQLNQLGYSNVRHYTGLNWIREGRIDPAKLGNKNMWVAQYLYEVNSTNYHQEYGAWQWSDKMSFPGVRGIFDISADYAYDFSDKPIVNSVGPYQKYGKYVTINSKNYDIYGNFNWKKRNQSANYYGQPLEARGYYNHSNGSRYLSLYDKDGYWVGYINENATKLATEKSGFYQSYGKYVTVSSKNYAIYSNFSWKKRSESKNYYGKPLLAKGYYDNFNGNRYLSLYDKDNNWIGYVNEKATKLATNKSGFYQSYGKYVTVSSKNYAIYSNFSWKKRSESKNYYGKPLLAKGYYDNFNGSRYLSLYDKDGKWIGYVNEKATELATNKSGFYQSYGKYVTVSSKNYTIWSNFSWRKKDHSKNYYGKRLLARGYYDNFNGSRYLSLYDSSGKWIGYINEKGTTK